MYALTIPTIGEAVDYYVLFSGETAVAGPFPAVVLAVHAMASKFPRLDLQVEYPFDHFGIILAVAFKAGSQYWLPRGGV